MSACVKYEYELHKFLSFVLLLFYIHNSLGSKYLLENSTNSLILKQNFIVLYIETYVTQSRMFVRNIIELHFILIVHFRHSTKYM